MAVDFFVRRNHQDFFARNLRGARHREHEHQGCERNNLSSMATETAICLSGQEGLPTVATIARTAHDWLVSFAATVL